LQTKKRSHSPLTFVLLFSFVLGELPCKNGSKATSGGFGRGGSEDSFQTTEFSFNEFMRQATPALIVVGSIGIVLLALMIIIFFVAKYTDSCNPLNRSKKV
jgi:hypothetical protein